MVRYLFSMRFFSFSFFILLFSLMLELRLSLHYFCCSMLNAQCSMFNCNWYRYWCCVQCAMCSVHTHNSFFFPIFFFLHLFLSFSSSWTLFRMGLVWFFFCFPYALWFTLSLIAAALRRQCLCSRHHRLQWSFINFAKCENDLVNLYTTRRKRREWDGKKGEK